MQGTGGVQGTGRITNAPATQTSSGGVASTLCFANGINEIAQEDLIIVYPNHTSGKFEVRSEKSEVRSIEIYNVLGEKIYSLSPSGGGSGGGLIIDLSGKPKGIYFLRLVTENSIISKKIILD